VDVRRYFFHLLKGDETVIDEVGARLPDLGAVVRQAQKVAVQTIISRDASAREWTSWKLDVKDEDGTRLFFFPFDEVSVHDVAEAQAQVERSGAPSKST